jgi:hypothetical protein
LSVAFYYLCAPFSETDSLLVQNDAMDLIIHHPANILSQSAQKVKSRILEKSKTGK